MLIAGKAQGTTDHVPIYPRELAKRALEIDASANTLVHNRRSSEPTPSQENITMAKLTSRACEVIGVTIHDHVVIGKQEDAFLRALGLL